MNRQRLRMAALWAVAAALALAGCQTRASLTESAPGSKSEVRQRYKSDMAIFSVSPKGRQTIVLALAPTGARPAASPPPGPDVPVAPPPPPLQYRVYLLLIVNSGGGQFTSGQRFADGEVRATYYVYDDKGQMAIQPDAGGTITTHAWPLLGGFEPNEWWVSGKFELVLANKATITGEFFARPAPVLVERFMRERKL